jgi:RNA polymerase sigma factor (sigma-70 family)
VALNCAKKRCYPGIDFLRRRSLLYMDSDWESSPVAADARALVSALVRTHGERLRRFLVARVRNVADVADIVQEVYLRLLRVPNADSIRFPEAYLFTVAQHVVQQHALRQSAHPPTLDLAELLDPPPAAPGSDPALEADASQCLEELQGALDQLAPKPRAAFLLHRRDGLSLDEIATQLGTSRPMVKKYLMKALLRLREGLEKDR